MIANKMNLSGVVKCDRDDTVSKNNKTSVYISQEFKKSKTGSQRRGPCKNL